MNRNNGIEIGDNSLNDKTSTSGITLVALVITVIIMLILASITINFALGEGGLITRAKTAKDLYEQAGKNEQEAIANVWEELNKEPPVPPKDEEPPTATIIISGETTQVSLPIQLSATVKLEDTQSGVKLNSCKYVINTKSEEIGLEEESYIGGTFSSEEEVIPVELDAATDWYIHILTVDEVDNKKETIEGPITIESNYHEHKDVNGVNRLENYQSATQGGCYTNKKHTYQTVTGRCTGTYTILRTEDGNHPGSKGSYNCNAYCGWYGNQGNQCGNPSVTKQVVTGTYYTISCGKTNTTIEGYNIKY